MRTNGHDESNSHFLNFAKAPKSESKNLYYNKTQMEKAKNSVPLFLEVKDSVLELEIIYLEYCLWFAQYSQTSANIQAAAFSLYFSLTFQTHTRNW